jgi:homoserine O-acetyltransferase
MISCELSTIIQARQQEVVMLVEKKGKLLSTSFITEGGASLPNPVVAYEEYGNSQGPVILICHGGLSNFHAAGKYAESDSLPGWWDGIIGPGKAFDTDRFRVLSMNALGGMYGSTSPMSTDINTGNRYGPTFPVITLRDQVHFAAQFLDAMGIERIFAAAGPSMGSLHSLTLAALYPQRVERVIAVATAARMTASGMAMHHFMMNAIRMDPAFQGGWYDTKTPLPTMKLIWQVIKLYYTSDKIYKEMCFDSVPHGPGAQAARAAKANWFLIAGMESGIVPYDPNGFMVACAAINTHDLGEGFATLEEGVLRIKCPTLLINVDTDHEFPPACAEETAAILNAARPGQATVGLIRSSWGHIGCIREPEQLAAYITDWLKSA